MSDISQIALNGATYNVKDSTARTEAAKKVTASGGDIADTKVGTYTASSASYPVPAAGETPKVFMGKIKKFFEDIRNATTGACFIGQIVNNCVTNNAKLPLSAAQGKALMDLYTQLNSEIGSIKTSVASKVSTDTFNMTNISVPISGFDISNLSYIEKWNNAVNIYVNVGSMALTSGEYKVIAYAPDGYRPKVNRQLTGVIVKGSSQVPCIALIKTNGDISVFSSVDGIGYAVYIGGTYFI